MFPSFSASAPRWAALMLYATLATAAVLPRQEGGGKTTSNGKSSGDWPDWPGDDEFDYVVVGGGLTGLVAANRLSEDFGVSVLVLEYGVIDRSNTTQIPYLGSEVNADAMFSITSAPEPFLGDSTFGVSAGAVAGGGTTVNGMALDRASAGDYNSWEQLGNPGWGWDGLQPYFEKSADFIAPPEQFVQKYNYTYDESVYSYDGHLKTTYPLWQVPDTYKMFDGFTELGVPFIEEHAAGNAIGQFWMPASIDAKTQTRSSSLTAYYDPIPWFRNVKMLNEHQVVELTFEEGTNVVSGVKAINRKTNKPVSFKAKKEVILAAGAIHTPQILQLSGIGPKDVVEAAGFESKIDLPGVGSNFQDHPVAYLNWKTENTYPEPDIMSLNKTFAEEARQEYIKHKTGPYTKAQSNSAAFLSLSMVSDDVESLISSLEEQKSGQHLPESYTANEALVAGYEAQREILIEQLGEGSVAALEFPFGGSGFVPNAVEKPLSRGTIHLNASDPYAEPIVTHNALQNPFDRRQLFTFVQFSRKYFSTTSLSPLSPVEITPGANLTTEAEIISALTESGSLSPTFAHPSCSCPMMPKEKGGCVSSNLTVYGTEKLSVIDGSVMPIIPAAHLQATLYAVAEKAADVIKERNGGGWWERKNNGGE